MNIEFCGSRFQKQRFVSPLGVGNFHPVGHDGGGTAEPDVEVLRDLEPSPDLAGDIAINRLAQHVPREKCNQDHHHNQQRRNAGDPACTG